MRWRRGTVDLVWPLSLGQLVSWGSLYYSFGLFLQPMEAELGLSRTALTAALTVGLIVSGLFAPVVGRLIDRGHARAVMTAGSFAAALLLLAWSQVETAPAFVAIWSGLGVVLAATLYEPAFAVLVRHLGSDGRRAIAAMTLVAGFASTVFIPLTHFLIESCGWREALVLLAILNLGLALPLHALVLRRPNDSRSLVDDDRAATSAPGWRAALASPAFLWTGAAFTIALFTFSALAFHAVPLLQERGHALADVVLAMALFGPAQVAGRILVTLVAPNLDLRVLGVVAFGAPMAGLVVLAAGPAQAWTLPAFAIGLGIGSGVTTIARAVCVAELFDAGAFGAVNGLMTLPVNAARALAPSAVAVLWTWSGDYGAALWGLAGLMALALAAYLCGLRTRN